MTYRHLTKLYFLNTFSNRHFLVIDVILESLLLTLNRYHMLFLFFIIDFEQVSAGCVIRSQSLNYHIISISTFLVLLIDCTCKLVQNYIFIFAGNFKALEWSIIKTRASLFSESQINSAIGFYMIGTSVMKELKHRCSRFQGLLFTSVLFGLVSWGVD